MSRGNSSLLKEHTVAMNLVSSDVKILPHLTKFYFEDATGLEVRNVFECGTKKKFAKTILCNETCLVDLVASRRALCDDAFEFFWGHYYCLRECLYSTVMVAALPVLRGGAY
jgi:hypothetical protein